MEIQYVNSAPFCSTAEVILMCAVCMCNEVTAATSSNTGKLSKLSSTSTRYYTKTVEAHYSPARARCNDAAAAAVAARGAVAAVGGYGCGTRLDSSAADDSARRGTVYAGGTWRRRCGGTAAVLRRYCGGAAAVLRRCRGPTAFSFHI